jgi:endoglucanase
MFLGRATHGRRFMLRFALLGVLCCTVSACQRSGASRSTREPTSTARPVGAWTTQGTEILTPTGTPFVIAGVGWYGFETPRFAPFGLDVRDYRQILDQVQQYHYNTLRISFSNEMWERNPLPDPQAVQACPACQGKHARDVLGLIINYAGAIGLHIVLDDHRSGAGTSSEENGLWYNTGGGQPYTEQAWVKDWISVQHWVNGRKQTLGVPDTVTVSNVASDGFPTILGYDLRNEPHTPPGATYLEGATWGSGDGIAPNSNPNPNPFAPACVATSTCHDWRLAAERAGDTLLGDATHYGWETPLIFVSGNSAYPTATGNAAHGPYDTYRWGGQLQGVNGNANNPGAPIVLNAGGTAAKLGTAISNKLVYSTKDFGPTLTLTPWFSSDTCYKLGCASRASTSGLVNVWCSHWAYINLPPGRYGACTGGVNPHFRAPFPWGNTGSAPYSQAPIWIAEFGTGNDLGDLASHMRGSQGQWFTDFVNFIQSSYARTPKNNPGIPVTSLHWTYWTLNSEDGYALLGEQYTGLANPMKQYSFLCFIEHHERSSATPPRQQPCGSTGPLPQPY